MSESVNSFLWMIVGVILVSITLTCLITRVSNAKERKRKEKEAEILKKQKEIQLVISQTDGKLERKKQE